MKEIKVKPNTEIKNFIKICMNLSGGESKFVIKNEMVKVNGFIENRPSHKIENNDIVEFENNIFKAIIE